MAKVTLNANNGNFICVTAKKCWDPAFDGAASPKQLYLQSVTAGIQKNFWGR
jgi:hypothetical protein